MTKYEPLETFLSAKRWQEVPMTFREIESVIGAPLPPVAYKHRAWWSNNPSNSVITHSWLRAGYKTERVDMGGQTLVFRRTAAKPVHDVPPPASPLQPRTVRSVVEALRKALGGTVKIAEGVDLTEPTGETWDAETQ